MALNPYEHLRLCERCNGQPRVSCLMRTEGWGCGGSGFDNATAREAFEREHRHGAEPLPREDPRQASMLT